MTTTPSRLVRCALPALLTVLSPLAATHAAEPAGFYAPADFGAVYDGKTNDGPALQKAIDAAAAAGGGTVVLPAGRSALAGSFALQSHVTLRLDPGSRIVASVNQADYTEEVLIRARGAEDIAITGPGTIEGQGDAFIAKKGPYISHMKEWRPKLVMLERVRHARLSEITLRNSPRFTVQLRGCEDVNIQGISIYNNPELPNNDGIDPVFSHNVRIEGCTIVTGDDCIAVSNTEKTTQYGPCENIIVSHCVLACQDSALKIGSGTFSDVRNVIFSDCVVKLALRGIDIMARDGGDVENVDVHNIIVQTHLFAQPWWGASEAVYITAVPRVAGQKMGHVRHVRVSGVMAHGESGVFVRGTPESPIEDLLLEDISLDIAKTTAWPSRIDLRPMAGEHGPREKDITIAGFDLQDAQDVAIRDCVVRWAPNAPPEFGPVLQAVRVARLQLENLQGSDAHATPPPRPPVAAPAPPAGSAAGA
jgi:polygalacturonase